MTREAEQSALVARHAREQLPNSITRLGEYLSIPAISSDKAHHADVLRLSQKLQRELLALGFSDARVLRLDGALPLTCATRAAGAPGRPTLLIYGHLDLQPVRGENWNTPPHQATVIDGRLYARGAADDMGGWF
jgi:acetylornithine deacetylase/succinyl-diaminopimelate desuccinylase-like protein